jgi:hypothetical protein
VFVIVQRANATVVKVFKLFTPESVGEAGKAVQ